MPPQIRSVGLNEKMKAYLTILFILLPTYACSHLSARDKAINYLSLYYAAASGDELLVKALLDRGAPVDAPDVDSAGDLSSQAVNFSSPLQVAAEKGDIEIVRLILQHKPWVDHRCCDSPSALGFAAEKGHIEIVKMLLEAGANPNIQSPFNQDLYGTALDAARYNGFLAIAKILEPITEKNKKQK
jgi:ankyrin repeat protein